VRTGLERLFIPGMRVIPKLGAFQPNEGSGVQQHGSVKPAGSTERILGMTQVIHARSLPRWWTRGTSG
jgi:hypothetical protein